jgi:endo-1,4-beta-xylanase
LLTRRTFLRGAAAAAALGLIGCSRSGGRGPSTPTPTGTAAPAGSISSTPSPSECETVDAAEASAPLWRTAFRRGLVYGSSTATWQISDAAYAKLLAREAAILFTEDDLLWYRLRPKPTSGLDFRFGDRIIGFARQHGMLVFGAHLVWDEGFGNGWKPSDLSGLSRPKAHDLLFGTVDAVVKRYRGRVVAWSTVNEAIDDSGLRTDVPWYQTIGPSYVEQSFHVAHQADPKAMLVLNEFGFETDDQFGTAAQKRAATLKVLDRLLGANVPVHALGIQAHLHGGFFADFFDPPSYRQFLSEVANRGLKILITEMDVLDDQMPTDPCARDKAVADVYRRYLDVALGEPAVVSLMTFGLSDRYTWLEEDFPRDDGARRRPLPFDTRLRPKPAYVALERALARARRRRPQWRPPRA